VPNQTRAVQQVKLIL